MEPSHTSTGGNQVGSVLNSNEELVRVLSDQSFGKERFEQLDCFLAGDDVKNKKPDPSIYKVAAEKLGANPERCLVVEDSVIGLHCTRSWHDLRDLLHIFHF
ncbi:hypothetical protein MPTK1_1g13930 [Marchantia polymorpha subsp. ruderalis]|uniref:FCP1 homology domain-containing protein n=2 Tax=Marchantia polymorpha TaxID=3197 RepID=A0AAF6APW8_MARPO|nr:hypothetical protein MARPO_0019s0163 [Marchantia polymorpha]BBM98488.1 hypothetical protein Mp_1g13930 [Marchantia polymorpha subsp. ruderalis]|eukprot:PTQ44759.1 hypothetical protein MARPO_0019s0163 [Marchantia polymorpha]